MKRILWVMAISAVPTLVTSAYAQEPEARVMGTGDKVIVWTNDAGESGISEFVMVADDETAPSYAFVIANVDAPPAPPAPPDPDRDRRAVRMARVDREAAMAAREAAREAARNRGWLGVAIGRVHPSLATHLDLEDRGIVVKNIVVDGPADRAGLQVHDIILSVDGQEVGSQTDRAIELLGTYKPGDTVNLMVHRGGVNVPITVTLGSRADMPRPHEWRAQVSPPAMIEDEIRTRGRMMHRGPHGRWMMRDLGELDDIEGLPEDIRALVPRSGTRTIQIQSLADDNKVRVEVRRDGSSVVVKQDGDGPITVQRTDADGQTDTATFATAEELEQGDPEAYELFSQAGKAQAYSFRLDGLGDVEGVFEFDLDFDAEQWRDSMKEWRAKLEESLAAAREGYTESLEEAQQMLEELRARGWAGGGPRPPMPPFAGREGEGFMFRPSGAMGKPRHTFELRADGSIEVRIRRGDSELVQIYANEDDLHQRAPNLYEKYDRLMSLNEE